MTMRRTGSTASQIEVITAMVTIEQFGRDHWSTLAYFETLVVDNGGRIDKRRMRCDGARHPQFGHLPLGIVGRCPTRLKGGVELDDHDDWDCMDDLEAAGLIETSGTGMFPVVQLTPRGHEIANALRRHRADSGLHARSYDTFVLSESTDAPAAPPERQP